MIIVVLVAGLVATFIAAFAAVEGNGEEGAATGTPTAGPSSPVTDLVQRGQELAQANGCTACHSTTGGTIVGPTWQNLFGKTENLEDGSQVVVDEAYIRESILNPRAKIVQGFQPVMPSFTLSDGDIEALIAYIKSLSEGQ